MVEKEVNVTVAIFCDTGIRLRKFFKDGNILEDRFITREAFYDMDRLKILDDFRIYLKEDVMGYLFDYDYMNFALNDTEMAGIIKCVVMPLNQVAFKHWEDEE